MPLPAGGKEPTWLAVLVSLVTFPAPLVSPARNSSLGQASCSTSPLGGSPDSGLWDWIWAEAKDTDPAIAGVFLTGEVPKEA